MLSMLLMCSDSGLTCTQVGTFGVDFKLKETAINDEEVVVQVWDTAGQVL